MSITVVGSSAFDDIETPRGSRKRIVGGSCIYFSLAASFKTKVNIVSVVGKDFPKKTINILNKKSISTEGLVVKPGRLLVGAVNIVVFQKTQKLILQT